MIGHLLALLLVCGLRRHELASLTVGHLQQREGHRAIVDLRGKGGHVRTIPVPAWVHGLLDDWTRAARISAGSLFRRVSSKSFPPHPKFVCQLCANSAKQGRNQTHTIILPYRVYVFTAEVLRVG